MYIYYNKTSLNDTLIFLKNNQQYDHQVFLNDDLLLFYHGDELIGLNLFNASEYLKNLNEGYLYPTTQLIQKLSDLIKIKLSLDNAFKGFVVGKILEVNLIPNTHLHICLVDIGDQQIQIICGAQNVRIGLKTVVATPNLLMPNGNEIKKSKLMNYDSFGMLCSQKELNINNFNSQGIVELNDEYQVGQLFSKVYSNL